VEAVLVHEGASPEKTGLRERDSDRGAARLAPGSFEAFFSAEYRRVLGLAVVLCGRRVVAEEVTQDAFVAAFRHWDRLSSYDDRTAWVRRVAINMATSAFRRRARETRALLRLSARPHAPNEFVFDDGGFWDAVRELPRRQAQCIALHYVEDRSVTEIASVLGIAEATVRVHLHAGRSGLATRLGDEFEERLP
jgi:RNA polymerase sigma-70 factor (ECF subfamily)